MPYLDEDGRRRHRYVTGRDRATVRASLARLSSSPSPEPTGTVGELLARWRDDVVTPTLRRRTALGYTAIIRDHLGPALGDIALARLSAPTVQRFVNRKLASGLAPRTVGHILAALRTALAHGVRWGLLERNVASFVPAPRVPQGAVAPLGVEQARSLIAATAQDRLGALYVLALTTGMRRGELLGLRWADIEGDRLHVRKTLHRVGDGFRLEEPKTERSRRTIPLSKLAVSALRGHRARQNAERLATTEWVDNGLVFTTPLGSPLDGSTVSHRFARTLVAASLPPVRFHDLRHSAASILLAEGVSMRAIADLLGHATPTVTANVYAHLLEGALRDSATAMDAALG